MDKDPKETEIKPLTIRSGRTLSIEQIMEMQKEQNVPESARPISINIEETDKNGNKFYLPRLSINDPTMWESQPMEKRRHLTDEVAYQTCLGNCCGVPGLKSGCCNLDPDDIEHVLGPLDEEWIKDTIKWLRKQGIMVMRSDLVIDWEEGKLIGEKFFNGHKVFESKESYPIMRFQVSGPRFVCKFLNNDNGKCTIYEKRPNMCRDYYCQYIQANFLVRTKKNPNTYTKLR
jgi:Fe-S-cluster containining protein